MTALNKERATRIVRASNLELAATASTTYYQGAMVGFDVSTGLVDLPGASTDFVPIGLVAETKTLGASGGTILVTLFRELVAVWMANSADTDEIDAAGGLAYAVDDQTVAKTDGSGTRSVVGRVWRVDPNKGVLVEPVMTAGYNVGGTHFDPSEFAPAS